MQPQLDQLIVSELREPFAANVTPTTVTITGPPRYIQLIYQAIIQGIDLWDESELTG